MHNYKIFTDTQNCYDFFDNEFNGAFVSKFNHEKFLEKVSTDFYMIFSSLENLANEQYKIAEISDKNYLINNLFFKNFSRERYDPLVFDFHYNTTRDKLGTYIVSRNRNCYTNFDDIECLFVLSKKFKNSLEISQRVESLASSYLKQFKQHNEMEHIKSKLSFLGKIIYDINYISTSQKSASEKIKIEDFIKPVYQSKKDIAHQLFILSDFLNITYDYDISDLIDNFKKDTKKKNIVKDSLK